jgi:hypothetical protein
MRFATVEKFSELSGYTPDAIRSKIKRGDWIQGHEWQRAPDGRTLIDIGGYESWVEGKGSGEYLHRHTKSASN